MSKGQATEIIIPILFIFGMVITGIVLGQVVINIRDTAGFENESQQVIVDTVSLLNSLDTGLIIAYIGLVFVAILTAFLIDVHPVFVFVQVILMIMLFIYPVVIQEVFDNFVTDSALASGAALFPKTTVLMSNLPEAYTVTFLLWSLTLYLKFRIGGGPQFGF